MTLKTSMRFGGTHVAHPFISQALNGMTLHMLIFTKAMGVYGRSRFPTIAGAMVSCEASRLRNASRWHLQMSEIWLRAMYHRTSEKCSFSRSTPYERKEGYVLRTVLTNGRRVIAPGIPSCSDWAGRRRHLQNRTQAESKQ